MAIRFTDKSILRIIQAECEISGDSWGPSGSPWPEPDLLPWPQYVINNFTKDIKSLRFLLERLIEATPLFLSILIDFAIIGCQDYGIGGKWILATLWDHRPVSGPRIKNNYRYTSMKNS